MNKICSKCKIEKDAGEFYKRSKSNDGLVLTCKECFDKRVDIWRKKNPKKNAEYCCNWQKNNQEKMRESNRKNRQIYRAGWLSWFAEQGLPVPNRKLIHYHHLQPENKNFSIGKFICRCPITPENIQILEDEIKKCCCLSTSIHNRCHSKKFRNYFSLYTGLLEKKILKE